MDPAHLQELSKLEDNYWWHVAKRSLAFGLIDRYAQPNDLIVEAGVGAAGNLKYLQDKGFRVHGLDLMPEAIEHCYRRGIQAATRHDLCEQWPFPSASAKIVLLLDVLEHLPQPVKALQHAADILDSRGRIILTVLHGLHFTAIGTSVWVTFVVIHPANCASTSLKQGYSFSGSARGMLLHCQRPFFFVHIEDSFHKIVPRSSPQSQLG